MGTPERANRKRSNNRSASAVVLYRNKPIQVSLSQLRKIRELEKSLRISRSNAIALVLSRFV